MTRIIYMRIKELFEKIIWKYKTISSNFIIILPQVVTCKHRDVLSGVSLRGFLNIYIIIVNHIKLLYNHPLLSSVTAEILNLYFARVLECGFMPDFQI